MFQINNWLNQLDRLQHLFAHSGQDEQIIFDIDLSEGLCRNKKQAEKFKKDPSLYIQNVSSGLKKILIQKSASGDADERKALQIQRKLENTFLHVKYVPYTQKIYKTFEKLNSDDVGSWIVITGTVIQATQKKTLDKSKLFVCCQCGATYRVRTSYENSYRFQMPNACTNKVQKQKSKNIISQLYANLNKRKQKPEKQENAKTKLQKCGSAKFDPVEQDKICIDYQQLRVQQQFQFISSGKIPQTIVVVLQGNVSSSSIFRPGDDLTITGVLSYRYKKLIKDFRILPQLIIVANTITIEKSGNYLSQNNEKMDELSQTQMSKIYANFPLNFYSEFELTSKERVLIKQLQFRKQIVQSFCPAIYGRSMVKLGLILSLLGGVSLQNESSKIRGHSHVLLVGQPGTGKSVLLKEVVKLADRSFFTNGIGTTSAGLSVSYFKQGGDWMIEAGALVLADNGVCCIDELTLLSKKDQKSLLQSMQQQTISSAKASVIGKLNARTTVICACNPIRPGQKYDQDLDLEANTGLSIPLLTRFDMIFIMKDQKDISEDAQKCDHVLQKFYSQKTSKPSKYRKNIKQKLNLKVLLKKCKSFCPDLSSHEILTTYYTEQRKRESKVKTARAFQSLCRIAEAHAKLMLRESTILLDYMTAITITENNYFCTIQQYYAILDDFNKKHKTSFV